MNALRKCESGGRNWGVQILRSLSVMLIFTAFLTIVTGTALAGTQRDMTIVAHEDDDIIFMNPDIMHAIAANHAILTVYITAGDAGLGPEFWARQREGGSRAAYATMAGIADTDSNWTPIAMQVPGVPDIKVVQMKRAKGKAPIYLAFLRLPATSESGLSFDRNPSNSALYESLRMLWQNTSPTIDALYDNVQPADPTDLPGDLYLNSWNKPGLVVTLTQLMGWFKPTVIRTADATGRTLLPDGPTPDYWYFDDKAQNILGWNAEIDFNNPQYVQRYGAGDTFGLDVSGVYIYYPPFTDGGFNGVPPQYYNYDHSDHFFAGMFAKAATEGYYAKYGVRPTFREYHGYNIAAKPANVSGTDLTVKQGVLNAYGQHDPNIIQSNDPNNPYDPTMHYITWLSRQYGATLEP